MNTNRVRISRTVRASVSADGLVLLDLERGLVLASNPIGAQIWQLIETGLSRDEIAGRLVRDYGITRDVAEHDFAAFLSSLTDRGLVTTERE